MSTALEDALQRLNSFQGGILGKIHLIWGTDEHLSLQFMLTLYICLRYVSGETSHTRYGYGQAWKHPLR